MCYVLLPHWSLLLVIIQNIILSTSCSIWNRIYNFLCVYMKTIPPVTRETRVKWKNLHNLFCLLPFHRSPRRLYVRHGAVIQWWGMYAWWDVCELLHSHDKSNASQQLYIQGYFKLTTILICCSLFFIHCAVAPKWCHYSLQVAPKRNFHPHTAFFGRPHGLVKPKPNTKGYKIYSWVPLQSCTYLLHILYWLLTNLVLTPMHHSTVTTKSMSE